MSNASCTPATSLMEFLGEMGQWPGDTEEPTQESGSTIKRMVLETWPTQEMTK